MVAVLTAAVATFAIYHLSARVTAAKDRELEEYRTVPHQIGSLVVNVAGNTASASSLSGVVAFIRPHNRGSEPELLALGTALTNAGIPCKPYRYERLKGEAPKAIHIHVGKKPWPIESDPKDTFSP